MKLDAPPGVKLPYTLFHEGTYMLQREDGSLVVGATMEAEGKRGLTNEGQEKLSEIAESFYMAPLAFK
ncbi:hypothetical protein ACI2OX_17950 [Bacillus sp. N9]